MTKETSSKKQPKVSPKGPSVQQKPSFKPKKKGTEIDKIFAGKKRKLPENDTKVETKKPDTKKPVKVSTSNVKSHEWSRVTDNSANKIKTLKESGIVDRSSSRSRKNSSEGGPRKKTADGLTIYTEDELGYGKSDAGGTPLCPFDCDCCF
ncbi:hypothetical protein ABFX02_12G035600 [Erythranthe guttata]